MTVIEEVKAPTRSELIAGWYIDVFPIVASYIQKNGGGLEEAKDVFQEAIVLYYEKLAFTPFIPEKSDKVYLLGIAKNRWLKQVAKQAKLENLSQVDLADDDELEVQPITNKILACLKRTGEKCMELLQAFYYEKLSMQQMAHKFGYTSERSATVQKYKCLEKVRSEVKSKSLSYEDFFN